jgi:hypothetical protein
MGWFIYGWWVLCWGHRLVCEKTATVAGERICGCSCRRILIFFQARRWRGSLVSLIAEREVTRATLLATKILEGVLIRWRKKRTSHVEEESKERMSIIRYMMMTSLAISTLVCLRSTAISDPQSSFLLAASIVDIN